MESKDLMIGDWVYSRQGVPSRVTSITCDGIIETEDGVSNIEIAEPIPITPEILKKNGFEERDDLMTRDAEFQPYVIDKIGTEENYEIIVEWRDSFDNGAADGFNRESWCESWNFCCRSSISDFVSNNRKKIYVHELQHALRLCGITKEIEL